MQWVSRGLLAVLLGTMPWVALSPAAGPPSQWAALMHLGATAGLSVLACAGFATARGRAGAVVAVFVFSALMEGLQHFSPHRHGTWEDVGINALGCAAGVLIYFGVSVGVRLTLLSFSNNKDIL